jgi:hypothetical protein
MVAKEYLPLEFDNLMVVIHIVSNVYKYIGHETTNWLGCGGRRSEHCRRCVEGIVDRVHPLRYHK